ncbi:SDR family NAD(P)-dependent oxidoreductase [Chryseobacterium sp. M5A1_1a]
MKNVTKRLVSIVLLTTVLLTSSNSTEACTRVMYKGSGNTIITARSMDFSIPIPSNLWLFPQGMDRNGSTGQNTVKWTSRYGSMATSSWDIVVSDGMNEKGLLSICCGLPVQNILNFQKDKKSSKKGLAVSLWAQYALENFSTVAEAVMQLKKEEFVVVTDFIPGTDKYTAVHLSLSDPTGDNAILEYINRKLVIHHDPSYTVMTNDPIFEQQLAINEYWKGIPGNIFLPGTTRAADRFVRASYYIKFCKQMIRELPLRELSVSSDNVLLHTGFSTDSITKTVVITGSSSGVGRAAAEAFALEGCNIVIVARGQKDIDEVVELCKGLGVGVLGISADKSVAADIERVAEETLSRFGRIDIWVNNAGVMASGEFEEIPMEIHEQVIKTNLFGYMHGAYNAIKIFKKTK